MKETKESTVDIGGEKVADGSVSQQCRNKKRLLKKAPEAPKRFKSAYICYVTKKMDEIKEESAGDIKVRRSKIFLRFEGVKIRIVYKAIKLFCDCHPHFSYFFIL